MESVEGIFRFVVDRIFEWIVNPFLRDPSYRSGYLWGLATAGALIVVKFVLIDRLVYFWNRILQFFRPTKGPSAPSKGPTPFELFLQFLVSLVSVGLLIALLVAGIMFVIWQTM